MVGYIRAPSGLGESSRMAARALESIRLPFNILNAGTGEDLTWNHKESDVPAHAVNLFHINADSMPAIRERFGEPLWQSRFNIGYWHWELPEMREEDLPAFGLVQEVWVPTSFVRQAIEKSSPGVPVVEIPHGVQVGVDYGINRDYFGLPRDRYLFLMMYDLMSHAERKNPSGAIEAFKIAFGKQDAGAGLVVKLNNSGGDPADTETGMAMLQQAIEGFDHMYLLDRNLSKLEVNSLINVTDSYISLHRAEGFGLVLAEAMFLGKPVIGTNWSGNTDFMNPTNSCPVNYELVQLGRQIGPQYMPHQVWAEPDMEHAASFMRELVRNPEWGRRLAQHGQYEIRNRYSPRISGEKMIERLRLLNLL